MKRKQNEKEKEKRMITFMYKLYRSNFEAILTIDKFKCH